MRQNILITGASSAIARALAERLAQDGDHLILAGRDLDDLRRTAADLRVRFGVEPHAMEFEATAFDRHGEFFEACLRQFSGTLDRLIVCHGLGVDQPEAQRDTAAALRMIDVNYSSVVSLGERAAAYFEQRQGGGIAVISSVAGDRGRRSNYLYGAPKAGLNCYLEGLRYRLASAGVTVLTIKPGFVDTKMTWGKPGMFLVASPQTVARDIHRAMKRGRSMLYTPWFWRWIMLLIRSIPAPIFKRMKV